ncbi:hypothetical protein B0H13DRAFT_2521420 [Mycena leptocephala]|nr:hypothetical protein B0H13DRAFT_2521420 [Mycena leptocephala]
MSLVALDDRYNYKLPPLVDAVRKNWERTLQSGLILSASFAIASILLFTAIPMSIMLGSSAADAVLQVFAYGSVVFNLSGALGSFVLIDLLGDMPLKASRGNLAQLPEHPPTTSVAILRSHGIPASWTWIMFHWACLSQVGMWFFFVELVLYAWLTQAIAIKVASVVFTSAAVLPLFMVFLAT